MKNLLILAAVYWLWEQSNAPAAASCPQPAACPTCPTCATCDPEAGYQQGWNDGYNAGIGEAQQQQPVNQCGVGIDPDLC